MPSPGTTRRRAQPLLTILLVAATAIAVGAGSIVSIGAGSDEQKIEVILSGLPKMRIRSYQKLKEIAGATMRQRLEMTRSELWSIDPGRLDALTAAARRYGVKVMPVSNGAMSMMVPMKNEPKMKPAAMAMISQVMGSPAAMGMTMMMTADPAKMEHALTTGMHADASSAAPATFDLPLDADTTVTVRRTRVELTKDGCIWHGVIEGTDEPVTLLWWAGGRLTGTVTHKGRMYSIRHMAGHMHAMMAFDPVKMPPEHAPTAAMRKSGGDMRADPLVKFGDASMMRPSRQARAPTQPGDPASATADARVPGASGIVIRPTLPLEGGSGIMPPPTAAGEEITIDLVVAYTKAAASRYTSIERDLISLAVEEANQSFRNSGVGNVRLRLVHAYQTSYTEKGEHFDHLWRFADKGDGVMEEIHQLRSEKHADVALLIVHDPIGCGLATRVAADADEAFAVIHHECAAMTYTLAHEVGHIIGARHDLWLDQSTSPYPFGHGYVHAKEWRTMMSYRQSCDDCPRLPVWSSPRVMIRGVAAGSDAHDNAEVIAREAKRVAGFK